MKLFIQNIIIFPFERWITEEPGFFSSIRQRIGFIAFEIHVNLTDAEREKLIDSK